MGVSLTALFCEPCASHKSPGLQQSLPCLDGHMQSYSIHSSTCSLYSSVCSFVILF